jgi:outer membrane protein TolC
MRFLACWAAVLVAGCGFQEYRAQALDPGQSAALLMQRSLSDPALAAYARGHGYPGDRWPPRSWSLPALTVAAMYFQPELDIARSEQAVAAAAARASRRPPVGVNGGIEHHDLTAGRDSAWSYGAALEIPLPASDRRAARDEQALAALQAADIAVEQAVWQVRTRLLRRFVELSAARRDLAALRDEAEARREMQVLLENRLAAGAASAGESGDSRHRLAATEQALVLAEGREAVAAAGLAQAIGITAAPLRAVELSFDELDAALPALDPPQLEARALRQRTDLRRGLARYAAAEAALKLEVARQYPELSFKPGYLWDQGDRRWSFAIGALLLPEANRGAIAEADAKRQLAAREFLVLQAAAVAEIGQAVDNYRARSAALDAAQALVRAADEQSGRMRRSFIAGAADRLDLLADRLDRIAAGKAQAQAQGEIQRAAAWIELGRPELAIDLFEKAVAVSQKFLDLGCVLYDRDCSDQAGAALVCGSSA